MEADFGDVKPSQTVNVDFSIVNRLANELSKATDLDHSFNRSLKINPCFTVVWILRLGYKYRTNPRVAPERASCSLVPRHNARAPRRGRRDGPRPRAAAHRRAPRRAARAHRSVL